MTSDFHDVMSTMTLNVPENDLAVADASFFAEVLKTQNVTQL